MSLVPYTAYEKWIIKLILLFNYFFIIIHVFFVFKENLSPYNNNKFLFVFLLLL